MNLRDMKSVVFRNLVNLPGWRTGKKIIVIESDDWGSIRMPSKRIYNRLLDKGIRVDKCPFLKYDSLASEDDLNELFETLRAFKDSAGNHPVFTANTIVANPDFPRIKQSGFNKYYFESFPETLNRYPKHQNSFTLWKEGTREKIFYPQLHGREHLQVNRWLKMLRSGSKETITAFENEVFGISTTVTTEKRESFMAAMDYDSREELIQLEQVLTGAQRLFKDLFGFSSTSFIATNYIWSTEMEQYLYKIGIKYIQGNPTQILPKYISGKRNFIKHYLGEKNRLGQHYLIRNCSFEPTIIPGKDVVSECLKQIKTAYLWKKPAIISSHRLNYIGSIVESNRRSSLLKMNELLTKILKIWPETTFMTSADLGRLINRE